MFFVIIGFNQLLNFKIQSNLKELGSG